MVTRLTSNTSDSLLASTSTACPYLGLKEDRESHYAYPSVNNCCYRAKAALPLYAEHQSQYCLSTEFGECQIYLNPSQARSPRGPLLGSVSRQFTRLIKRRWPVLVTLAAALLVFGGVAGSILRGGERGSLSESGAPAATALPQGYQRYQVRPGDTLRGVCEFFGVHPDDVIALNKLPSTGLLVPEATLIIPPQK